MIVFSLVVLVLCFIALLVGISTKPRTADSNEPPKPRIVLPTDSDIYSFAVDSKLTPEEWQLILNAGWLLLTCTTEQYKDYAGCYPEAPSYHRTRWHYVFRKTPARGQVPDISNNTN